jgi:hypothetical protein
MTKNKKPIYKNCRWSPVCIDPCYDGDWSCPNMDVVKFDENDVPIESTLCQHEQGSRKCYAIACPTCPSFEDKLDASVDLELVRRMDALDPGRQFH